MNYNKQLKIDNLDFNLIQDLSEKESKKVSGGQIPSGTPDEIRAEIEAQVAKQMAEYQEQIETAKAQLNKKFGLTP